MRIVANDRPARRRPSSRRSVVLRPDPFADPSATGVRNLSGISTGFAPVPSSPLLFLNPSTIRQQRRASVSPTGTTVPESPCPAGRPHRKKKGWCVRLQIRPCENDRWKAVKNTRYNPKGGCSMRRVLVFSAILLLCSVLSFAVVCTADDTETNSRSAALVARPFKGTWIGTMYIVGYCPNGSLQILDTGKGFSTQMGASEWVATLCMDPITGLSDGNAVVTGANGDAISLVISLQSTGIGGPQGTWFETEIVTGGTGRFADAEGTSTSSGTWLLPPRHRSHGSARTRGSSCTELPPTLGGSKADGREV